MSSGDSENGATAIADLQRCCAERGVLLEFSTGAWLRSRVHSWPRALAKVLQSEVGFGRKKLMNLNQWINASWHIMTTEPCVWIPMQTRNPLAFWLLASTCRDARIRSLRVLSLGPSWCVFYCLFLKENEKGCTAAFCSRACIARRL